MQDPAYDTSVAASRRGKAADPFLVRPGESSCLGLLDRPVSADDGPQLGSQPHQRRNVEARLLLDFLADFPCALNHDDTFQSGPSVAFLQPGHVVDDGVGTCFDAAVIAVDRLMAADVGVALAADREPSIASMSSSAGMATISFDFSATLTWPSTRR